MLRRKRIARNQQTNLCNEKAHTSSRAGRAQGGSSNLLKPKAYRTTAGQNVYSREEFFSVLGTLPVTVFATIMHGPFLQPLKEEANLGNRFRFLLQRIELLAAERGEFANILFDGRGTRFGQTSRRFSNYLYRSNEGRASVHIADAPTFVDSSSSAGIQIADMCAYTIRVYQENRLFAESPAAGDEYLYAVRRWYRVIEKRTANLSTRDGESRPGFYFLRQGER